MKHEITRDDIMDLDAYEKVRAERKKAVTEMKKDRRVACGPDATFYFENFDTMWHQIHEMLRIEKGGEEQIEDELRAYNPLIPKGNELVATLMFEIEDPDRRDRFLRSIGHVDRTISLTVGDDTVPAVPEDDVDRTDADGRASSIHFLHFPLTPEQKARFKQSDTRITLGINHENYGHVAVMPERVRAALAGDLD